MTTLSLIFLSLIFSFLAIILDIVLIKYGEISFTLTVKRVIWLLLPIINIVACFISLMIIGLSIIIDLREKTKPKWYENTIKSITTFLNKQIYP